MNITIFKIYAGVRGIDPHVYENESELFFKNLEMFSIRSLLSEINDKPRLFIAAEYALNVEFITEEETPGGTVEKYLKSLFTRFNEISQDLETWYSESICNDIVLDIYSKSLPIKQTPYPYQGKIPKLDYFKKNIFPMYLDPLKDPYLASGNGDGNYTEIITKTKRNAVCSRVLSNYSLLKNIRFKITPGYLDSHHAPKLLKNNKHYINLMNANGWPIMSDIRLAKSSFDYKNGTNFSSSQIAFELWHYGYYEILQEFLKCNQLDPDDKILSINIENGITINDILFIAAR